MNCFKFEKLGLKLLANVFVICVLVLYANITEAAPRIGLMDLKNTTTFSVNSDLERNIEDMIITELVNTGRFDVVERTQLQAMLKEQKLAASGVVDASTGAQLGEVNGVQYLLYINLTNVSTSKSKSGFAGISIAQSCVNVNITARVVNAATGSIVMASNSSGSVTLTSGGMQGIGAGGRTNVSENDVLNAAEKAIKKLTVELAAKSNNLR